MYCFDANVWVYYLDSGLDEHEAVSGEVRPILRSEPLFSTAVLRMEVVHYLTNQLSDSEDTVEEFLNLADVIVATLTDADVRRGAELLGEHPNTGMGGRDATVLAAIERFEVTELWTHDAGLLEAAEKADIDITVVDPVERGRD